MKIRYFALVYGIVFLVVGVAGFIPGLVTPMPMEPEKTLTVTAMSGLLLGLFPVNILHNIVHILFGLWGLVAYRTVSAARLYGQAVAVIYALFVVMGFIPVLWTTFGLVPLYGHDIWLHAVLAVIAAYFGFAARPAEAHHAGGTTASRA